MNHQQLYNRMFNRKSIRKYDMASLSQDTLVEIKDFASSINPLDQSIKYEFSYLTTDDVKNLLPIKAPHYICLYSEKKDGYLMNAGFILQQIDLFLSENELGSCWLGMAKPSKNVEQMKNGLEFVIMLAFGSTKDQLHRVDKSEFKRKSMAEICSINGLEEILEPVRLAPSASNSQPWFFSGNKNEITVSREKLSFIKAPIYKRMNQIDIGIALFHLWLSLNHVGKSAVFDFNKGDAPSGYEFMIKVKIQE
jgi:nitroreductase